MWVQHNTLSPFSLSLLRFRDTFFFLDRERRDPRRRKEMESREEVVERSISFHFCASLSSKTAERPLSLFSLWGLLLCRCQLSLMN